MLGRNEQHSFNLRTAQIRSPGSLSWLHAGRLQCELTRTERLCKIKLKERVFSLEVFLCDTKQNRFLVDWLDASLEHPVFNSPSPICLPGGHWACPPPSQSLQFFFVK
jgi:hypothetical protein